jgi:hypothetical protein
MATLVKTDADSVSFLCKTKSIAPAGKIFPELLRFEELLPDRREFFLLRGSMGLAIRPGR